MSPTVSLVFVVLVLLSVETVTATRFELFQLPVNSQPHPQPYCNDGSQAGYYHDTDYTKLGRVHVHLEGGNLCDSDQDCLARCDADGDGEVEGRLCTASTQQVLVREGGLYSNNTENPLADYWHVIVPYCSSDTWAGTGRSEDTGYYFHGKHIFRDVLNSLSHHYDLFSATDLVLSGSSAGGFGVGLNCDDVADWLTGANPDMTVRCLADAPDFIPWWVHTEHCPRREENYQRSVSQFWARDPDLSCRQPMDQHGAEYSSEEATCGILSQYISFISTPLFIAVSQVDSLISGGYGCPPAGSEEEILLPWLSSTHELITNLTVSRPELGWWAPSCSLHTLLGHQEVRVEDRLRPGQRLSLYQALASWMEGETVHAVDSLDTPNPTCPIL